MKRHRLSWLVATMVVLAIVRVLVTSPGKDEPPVIAEAVVRHAPSARTAHLPGSAPLTRVAALSDPVQGEDLDEPGNAFGVRPPPPPPYVPAGSPTLGVVRAQAAPRSSVPMVVPIASEPPPQPAPFQVIGTWDDGKAPGVFLSSPTGTVLARPGMTLLAEYRVDSITPQQISLLHLASRRVIRLAILRPPETPRAYP